jgi:hypothetical protein
MHQAEARRTGKSLPLTPDLARGMGARLDTLERTRKREQLLEMALGVFDAEGAIRPDSLCGPARLFPALAGLQGRRPRLGGQHDGGPTALQLGGPAGAGQCLRAGLSAGLELGYLLVSAVCSTFAFALFEVSTIFQLHDLMALDASIPL